MKTYIRHFLLFFSFFFLLSGSNLFAQTPQGEAIGIYETSFMSMTPQFFTCLIAGVLLAMGFQVLLTMLSVASGISLVGNIEEKGKSSNPHHESNEKGNEEDQDNKTSTAVKISNAFGIWTILTVSLSLFFASLLAVKLSLIANNAIGMTLGLVIWASFFTLMMYLEGKAVSTLLGGVVSTALTGLRSSFSTVKNMFSTSEESKMQHVAESAVSTLRKELTDALDTSEISKKMDEYIKTIQAQEPDYRQVKNELANLLKDIQLEERSEVGASGVHKKIFIKLASEQPKLSKKDLRKLSDLYDEVSGIAKSEGNTSDKMVSAFDRFSPGSEEDSKKFRSKLEEYLKATGKEELQPEVIKQDFEAIFSEPGRAKEVVKNRFNHIDKQTLVSVISQRTDMSEKDAKKISGYVETAFDFVKSKFAGDNEGDMGERSNEERNIQRSGNTYYDSDKQKSVYEGSDKLYARRENVDKSSGDKSSKGIQAKVEDKFRNFLASLERPELNYDSLKNDFTRILHDPKSTFKVLKGRFSQYDSETVKALLTSNENISQHDLDKITSKIEEAKMTVLHKAEQVEREVQAKAAKLKTRALHEAEEARKAAATAAWWLTGTAIISGAASALGGILAITI